MSILLDEADAYERGMDDDLTFQTVRELAGTAYMTAPEMRASYLRGAREMLEIARKAVSE